MQLILGGVGAGLGAAFIPGGFLGMSGASIGWSIGSFLGGQLSAPSGPNVQGPRLNDRSVSTSAYGNLRPIVYGTYRVGGEIIWSTELKEHKHKEESGKGGGGGGSYTTYTYTVSLAAALCEGPIVGIRKIWLDSKLIWTQADDASAAELNVSDKIAKKIAVYTGTETQYADSVIEAYLGSGNVPAYRGTAYLVFHDLDVTDFGQRIPQITVEVVATGSYSLPVSTLTTYPTYHTGAQPFVNNGIVRISDYVRSNSWEGTSYDYSYSLVDGSLKRTQHYKSLITLQNSSSGIGTIAATNESSLYQFFDGSINPPLSGIHWLVCTKLGSTFSTATQLLTRRNLDNAINLSSGINYDLLITDAHKSMAIGTTAYFYHFIEGRLYRFDVPNVENPLVFMPSSIVPAWDVVVDSTRQDSGNFGGHEYPHMCRDAMSGDLFVGIYTNGTNLFSIKRYDSDGNYIEEKFSGLYNGGGWGGNHGVSMAFDNGIIWLVTAGVPRGYDWESEDLLYTGSAFAEGASADASDVLHVRSYGNLLIAAYDGTLSTAKISLERNSSPLDEVVEDLCERVGINVGDVDTSDLADDNVRGYMVSTQISARGAIQQLASAYFFDGSESDGVLKFVKRGGAVAAIVDDDELGCYGDGEDIVELWDAIRTPEEELPQELTLMYAQYDADYQQGAQFSLREEVLSGTKLGVQLSIAFTDDEAKSVVDKMMFSAWVNRHGFTLRTYQKWLKLESTDIITARDTSMRIIRQSDGLNGVIELECVREIPEIYSGQVGAGATGSVGGQSVLVGGPTMLEIMDIPNLRDSDYNVNGIYWAATGMLDDWRGGALLISRDNGDTWKLLNDSYNSAIIGQATTILGDFSSGNIFDEKNVVRVQVSSALSSATMTEIINGANLCLIGDELLQFRTATLISTGVYDLSGLLRGRKGTEYEISAHDVNERFVLIDSATVRFIDLEDSDLNVPRMFGSVTVGDSIEDIETETDTYTGQNVKPYQPVYPIAGLQSGHDIQLSCMRRTRFHNLWQSGRVPSDDESTISFDLEIYSDGTFATLKRSVSSVSIPWTYTSAMQVTDGGNLAKTVYFKIRQNGASLDSEWLQASLVADSTLTYSVLLLHMNGSNGSTNFEDAFARRAGTAAGNAQVSTAQSKFGGASAYFDGSGDYISFASSADFDFTDQAFEIECWVRLDDTTGNKAICGRWVTSPELFAVEIQGSTKIKVSWYSGVATFNTVEWTTSFSANTWYHIAVSRQGTTWYAFKDGVLLSASLTSISSQTIKTGTNALTIGSFGTGTSPFKGYIDELRITKGAAQHTASFTPQTSEYTE